MSDNSDTLEEPVTKKVKTVGGIRPNSGRKADCVRQHFEQTESKNGNLKWICSYCKKEVSSKACRLRAHFTNCTARVKPDASKIFSKQNYGNTEGSTDSSSDSPLSKLSKMSAAPDQDSGNTILSTETTPECCKANTTEVKIRRQSKVSDFLVKTTTCEKDRLDLAVAQYFYSCNVPFSHAERLYFKELLKLARPGYVPPTRKMLGGALLDKVYDSACADAEQYLRGKSVTLIQDGWSSIHNDPVIANCVTDGQKSFFISSVDTGCNQKTSEYCLTLAKEAIDEAETRFGCRVKSFASDNEAKMKKMRSELGKLYSDKDNFFITYGCASHYLNLLAGDICKLPCINTIIKQVVELSKYFRNHHDAKGFLKEYTGSCIPQLPGETRWNSILECLQSFVQNRDFYLKIVEAHEERIDRNICKIIQNIALMKEVRNLILQLKPIGISLDRLQGENANISLCLEEFILLKQQCDSRKILEPYKELVDKRFDDCITPAHIVAFLLNPKYINTELDPDLEEDGRAWLININEEFLPLLVKFRLKDDPFPKSFFQDVMMDRLTPIQWWEALAKNKKINSNFLEFGLHLQRCIASSASIERIFSTFSFVQNKLRNKLGLQKASKLVHCYKMLNMKAKENEPNSDEEY